MGAFDQIAQMITMNKYVLGVSADVKQQLHPFLKMIDDSSQISTDTLNGYGLRYCVT